jgi:hypothetical protein
MRSISCVFFRNVRNTDPTRGDHIESIDPPPGSTVLSGSTIVIAVFEFAG